MSTLTRPFAETAASTARGEYKAQFRATALFQRGFPQPAGLQHMARSLLPPRPPPRPLPRAHACAYSRLHRACLACRELLACRVLQEDPEQEGSEAGREKDPKLRLLGLTWLQTTSRGKKRRANALINLPGGPGDPLDLGHPAG